LLGDEFSAADCAAFQYALKIDVEDDELFHRILHERRSTRTCACARGSSGSTSARALDQPI
jgi:hypothetical protein